MESKYKKIWNELLSKKNFPKFYSGTIEISYDDFKLLKDDFNKDKAKDIIAALIDGKVLLVKGVFNKNLVNRIKTEVVRFWKNNPNTFYTLDENCPDFHRIITPEIAKKYSVGAVRHTTYFFPWNDDPCKFNEIIYERWEYSKYLAGLKHDENRKNTPKDGTIDRIQIACYPPKYGGLEKHSDTTSNSPLAVSCYLSSRKDKDFISGGFFGVDKNNEFIDIENSIDSGDMSLYCGTVQHGVEAIDKDSNIVNYDWNSGTGRWWMGLFSPDSDMKKNRKTAISLERYHSESLLEKE